MERRKAPHLLGNAEIRRDGGEISLYGTGKNGRRIMISYTVFGEKTPAWLEA